MIVFPKARKFPSSQVRDELHSRTIFPSFAGTRPSLAVHANIRSTGIRQPGTAGSASAWSPRVNRVG